MSAEQTFHDENNKNEVHSPSENVVNENAIESNALTATAKRKRPTDKETAELTVIIKDDLLEGHPPQAIALAHGVSLPRILKLFAKLMSTDFRNGVIPSKYEVTPAGTPASKLPFEMLMNADFIRIERHENGLYIQPFNVENYHA